MFVKLTDKDGVKLQTRDTLCAEDINVFPNLQSIEATENGTYTVEDGYAGIGEVKVNVSIPDGDVPEGEIPEGYVKPEGEIVITSNGTHDVAGKKTAVVRVPIEGAMNINGVIKQYKVNAGASVSAGDFVEFVNKYGSGYFGSTTPIYLRACKVSERTVLAVYTYSGVLYGVVFEIGEDGYVSVGDQKVISKSSSGPLALSVLSDNTALLDDGGHAVVLIKPQFEVGKASVGKGGIVRDVRAHREAVERVLHAGIGLGLCPVGLIVSPVTGGDGNREFLVDFIRMSGAHGSVTAEDIRRVTGARAPDRKE